MIQGWAIAPLAMALDWMFEERLSPVHPVVIIGRWGRMLEPFFLRHTSPGWGQRAGGVLFILLVALPFSLLAGLLTRTLLPTPWGDVLSVYLAALFLAGKGLYVHVQDVSELLSAGDIPGARVALSKIVGRDTAALDEVAIARGALESLSENLTDAVVAPIFFLLLGGVPLLVFYKAVSTMDSQVGYKNDLYRDFGWASARLDDLLAFVPARLTLLLCLTFALFFQGGELGFRQRAEAMFHGRLLHPSPNSGHGIAGYGALLGVSLGGGASYGGVWVDKPVIGEGLPGPEAGTLKQALDLYRHQLLAIFVSLVLFLFLRILILVFIHPFPAIWPKEVSG